MSERSNEIWGWISFVTMTLFTLLLSVAFGSAFARLVLP